MTRKHRLYGKHTPFIGFDFSRGDQGLLNLVDARNVENSLAAVTALKRRTAERFLQAWSVVARMQSFRNNLPMGPGRDIPSTTGSSQNLTGSLPTVGFGLAVVSGPVDSLGTLVNMCKCAGRASVLCMRTDGNE